MNGSRARFLGPCALVLTTACPAPPPQAAAPQPAAADPAPLSAADENLLATDPAALSPELRRKRAHALRRKIMQNPDSTAARILTDLNAAYQAGEIDPGQKPNVGPVFHSAPKLAEQPASPPPSTRPPAGVRLPASEGRLPAP